MPRGRGLRLAEQMVDRISGGEESCRIAQLLRRKRAFHPSVEDL
jgi:hypothetical protein